jgi:pimeloyl-ACP methyl ester carboxylesterase
MPSRWTWFALAALAVTLCGCGPSSLKDRMDLDAKYASPDRLAKGLVVILPGIEGESAANRDIRKGLDEGGVPYALVIYRWGFPVPGLGLLVNQTDTAGDRRAGADLAAGIVKYQSNHPDCPIFLVGHSAGGGVAIFALEALADVPNAKPVTGAILLSSSISADYSLDRALRMIERGLVNGFNPDDTAMLGAGTAMFGNVDGGHGDSAGRTGFHRAYAKLYQFKVNPAEVHKLADPHFILTDADLLAEHAPAWVCAEVWPPTGR